MHGPINIRSAVLISLNFNGVVCSNRDGCLFYVISNSNSYQVLLSPAYEFKETSLNNSKIKWLFNSPALCICLYHVTIDIEIITSCYHCKIYFVNKAWRDICRKVFTENAIYTHSAVLGKLCRSLTSSSIWVPLAWWLTGISIRRGTGSLRSSLQLSVIISIMYF